MAAKPQNRRKHAPAKAAKKEEPKGRGGATRWKKGQSGNPGGRPADYGHFRELCRSKSPQAVAALELALANGDSASVAAARVLLEYGWGKPSAAPEDLEAVKAGAVQLSQLSREELLAIAALPDEDSE